MAGAERRRAGAAPGAACPLCGAASAEPFAPFCSSRCADRDLANWLGGRYAIPAADDGEDGIEEDAAGSGDRGAPTRGGIG